MPAEARDGPAVGRGASGAGWQKAAALALYMLIAAAYFGLAVRSHPGRYLIGTGADPEFYVWALAWLPHALAHGLNPFVSHVVWAPEGVNLTWTTAVPGLALVLSPLTALAGPVVAYNTAAVALPALAAWTAFLLCRYLTRRFLPSVVAGYLFGFSSYMLGHEEGHLPFTAVFLLPLVALLVLRFLAAELTGRGLAWRLGVVLAAQVLISTEVLFTSTLALAAGIIVGAAAAPALRPRLRAIVRPLVGAYLLAAVVTSPFLYYALTGFNSRSINLPAKSPADLLNFFIPTGLVALSHDWGLTGPPVHFGEDSEAGAYLGVPLLLVIALYLWGRRRTPAGRALAALLGLAVIAALGTKLQVNGHRLVVLPWRLVSSLPAFNNVLPVRLSLYVWLLASVILALWAASSARRWLRVLLPALVVVTVLPHFGTVPYLGHPYWKTTPDRPPFFTDRLYRSCLRPGETVLVFPFGQRGDSLLWQAESGFAFRMAGGYVSSVAPRSYIVYPAFGQIADGILPYQGMPAVDQLARAKGIATILIARSPGDPEVALWNGFLSRHVRPRRVGGVTLYPLAPGPAAGAACTARSPGG
jgi:hypothetical protein